jgi:ABC-type multidrug transport system ATPase subunit
MSITTSTTSVPVPTLSIPTWPPIPLNAPVVTVGRTDGNTVQIQHTSISRTHLKLTRGADGSVELEDLDSRFGTFVNGARIKKVVLKPGDSIRIGSSPPYRFAAGAGSLEVSLDGSGMTISLKGVGIERDGRKLIENFNLTIQSDSFVGVLGPSGAGKSLMLGTLSSTMIPTSGTLEFDDGHPVNDNLDYYRGKIGIVTQDDIVHSDLTVLENLDFAAQIRLPELSVPDRDKRIEFALEAVGLLEHRDKRVGVLSGGQRKRVSVAIELLLQPRLLLLDEPTSGLDPGMQARLMEMLRGLSRRGVTVVCTTHTLDTLNFFDQLLVLGLKDRVASVAYFGGPRELLPTFGVHTQMDLFDKLQSLSDSSPAQQTQAEADESSVRRRPRPQLRAAKPPAGKDLLLKQARVVFQRAYLGLVRDKMSVFMALIQPPILALLTVLAGVNQGKTIGITFFLVICAMWLGMTLTVREIVRERKLYIRDRLAGMHPLAYLAGKGAYAAAVVLVQSSTLWILLKMFGPFMFKPAVADSVSDMSFIAGWIFIVITGLGAAVLGLLVSTLSKSERPAVSLLPLVLLPQVVLSRAMTGEARKEWDDPSPYCAMLDFVRGMPLGGVTRAEQAYYDQAVIQRKAAIALRQNPFLAQQLGMPVPEQVPPEPTVPTAGPGMGRGLNFVLSAPMLTRPAAASIDMLGDKHATAGMVFFEFLYLIILVVGYTAILYFVFMAYEKTWNDIRSA